MPNRLFHYQRFVEDHFASLLRERKVRLSRPDSFNDPWDCRVRFRLPTDTTGRTRVINWIIEMNRKYSPNASESERLRKAQYFMSNPLELQKSFLRMEEQIYEGICNRYRVYCLSEKPDSPLMWAHYTDAHQGVCLEFDARTAPFTRQSAATKVEYREVYPAYDVVTVGYEPLVTKSADWSYEAEWRVIAEERAFALNNETLKTDDSFLIMPQGALKSVTIGCLANKSRRQLIARIVEDHAPGVAIRQAAPATDRYELWIDPPFDAVA